MSADAHAAVVEGHVVERKKRGRLRKYVVYAVEVAAGGCEWVAFRRFSEFHQLHTLLGKTHPHMALPPFPPKTIRLGSRKFRADFIEGRRSKLDTYLKGVLGALRVSRAPLLDAFLLHSDHRFLFAALRGSSDPSFGRANAAAPPVGDRSAPAAAEGGGESEAPLSVGERARRLSFASDLSSDEEEGPEGGEATEHWAQDGDGAGPAAGSSLLTVEPTACAEEAASSASSHDALVALAGEAELLRWAGRRGPPWQDRAASLPASGPARPPLNDLHRELVHAVTGLREILARGGSALEDADARITAEERVNAFLREETESKWRGLAAVGVQVEALRRAALDAWAQQQQELAAVKASKSSLVGDVKARRRLRSRIEAAQGQMQAQHDTVYEELERRRVEVGRWAAGVRAGVDCANRVARRADQWRRMVDECRHADLRGVARRGTGESATLDAGQDYERMQRTLLAVVERAEARRSALGREGEDGGDTEQPGQRARDVERLVCELVAENARLQGEANALRLQRVAGT